ncbi:SAM-dependent methyltransferase [Sabulicella rubraurantiaca]|uniref:SAM-dependent methyltransferase n=1 Tax=Sabulicella rubraurantiaca TaxID=2811429 RepID=UPI001A963F76|nr:class I SAM-dependent methyltransferase [Sabulicella rubraurantiaca]
MGEAASSKIQDHYASEGIAARILAALRAAWGEDIPVTPDALAPLDHFHGRGLKATEELAALLDPRAGERLLDIGGGIGGPARWIAASFGCRVTSLDLTPECCRTAVELSAATGLSDRVFIIEGIATDLPFGEGEFDRAYSENVAMNIADKPRFYAEALRVLRPGGVFAFSNYGAGPNGDPHFPLPWAAGPLTSFLASPDETREEILDAGFELVVFRDKTEEVLPDLRENRRRLEGQGLPPLGLQTLMGERIAEFQINVARSAEEGRLTIIEALLRKPT